MMSRFSEEIAQQVVDLLTERIAKLEAALQHFYDYGYDRGRCEEALKEAT